MPDKEKNTIIKLIQIVDLDKPSVNFSDKVIAEVSIIAEDEMLNDIQLVSLLKKNSLEIPNPDFTKKIMNKVITNTVAYYQPIISKKAWNVIIVFFASFIIYLLLSEPSKTYKNSYISEFSIVYNNLITNLGDSLTQNIQIPSILIVSILCLSILLLLDATLRTKKIF